MTIGYDGSKNPNGTSDVDSYTIATEDNHLEVTFNEVGLYKGYRIEYTTKITDFAAENFTNEAMFSYGDDKELPAEATAGGITRSDVITKEAREISKSQIEWTIDVNKSGISMDEVSVEDELPDELAITDNGVKVYRLKKSGSTWIEEKNPEYEFDGFPIELGDLSENDTYRIKYKTDITYDGDFKIGNGFTNKAVLKSKGTPVGDEVEKIITINRDPIIEKTGWANVNYENKKLEWTVTVNSAGHPLGNVVITDVIPAGLDIQAGDIQVRNLTQEKSVTVAPTIAEGPGSGEKTVTIRLDSVGIDKYEIRYSTTIIGETGFSQGSFKNHVGISGDGVGSGDHTSDDKTVGVPDNEYNKWYAGIDYNAKTISWKIEVKPTREAINNFKITDTFPNKGLILLPGTLTVKHGSDDLVPGTDYTLIENTVDGITNYNKGFILKFSDTFKVEKTLTVEYKTSFDPALGIEPKEEGQDYKSYAWFEGETDTGIDVELGKDATHKEEDASFKSGKKEGKLISIDSSGNQTGGWISGNERKIKWEVYINYLDQNLGTGYKVIDSWEYDGFLDRDSIEVREYTVAPNGGTTIGGSIALKEPNDYTVTPNDDGKGFEVDFGGTEINKRYVVIFTTSVPDISEETYYNDAILKKGENEHTYRGTIGYKGYNDFLSKDIDSDKAYTDDEITWKININKSLSVIKNPLVEDVISSGLLFINDSFKIFEYTGGTTRQLEVDEYTLRPEQVEKGKTKLTIEFTKNTIDSHYLIEYNTLVQAKSGQVNNTASFSGIGVDKKTIETDEMNATQMSFVGGSTSPNRKTYYRITVV